MPDPRTNAELETIVARWLGWFETSIKYADGIVGPLVWLNPDGEYHDAPPAYASDLNVWNAEIWNRLAKYNVTSAFCGHLMNRISGDMLLLGLTSTARQQAETLVRVIEEVPR